MVNVVAHAGDEQSQSFQERKLMTAVFQDAIHRVSHFEGVIPIMVGDFAIIPTDSHEESRQNLAVERELLIRRFRMFRNGID